MKKVALLCGFTFVLALMLPTWSYADTIEPWTSSSVQILQEDGDDDDDDDHAECMRNLDLSTEQKAKLDKLFDRLQQDHKELIDLYSSYGALTKEQQEKKLRALNEYITSVKKTHKWCVEFDDDEIEYEHHNNQHKPHKHLRDDVNEKE